MAKLTVLENNHLEDGRVYIKDDVIEVLPHEAAYLLAHFPKSFQVLEDNDGKAHRAFDAYIDGTLKINGEYYGG